MISRLFFLSFRPEKGFFIRKPPLFMAFPLCATAAAAAAAATAAGTTSNSSSSSSPPSFHSDKADLFSFSFLFFSSFFPFSKTPSGLAGEMMKILLGPTEVKDCGNWLR